MRILKFRIYLGGMWHYWGFIRTGKAQGLVFAGLPSTNMESLTMEEMQGRSNQFTGLKDKNGVEIYEGDILKVKFNGQYVSRVSWRGKPDAIAEVIWDYSGFRLNCNGKEDRRYADFYDFINDKTWDTTMLDMSLKHTEVIGNIYEHPELLKEPL